MLQSSKNFLSALGARVWRANSDAGESNVRTVPTRFGALDRLLPDRGWPQRTLIELLAPCGVGEMRLLMPVLAPLMRARQPVVWVEPPHIPYPRALIAHGVMLEQLLVVRARDRAQRLWAIEQALKSGAVAAVVAWLPEDNTHLTSFQTLRRLQLAAQNMKRDPGLVFLLRSPAARAACVTGAAAYRARPPASAGCARYFQAARSCRCIRRCSLRCRARHRAASKRCSKKAKLQKLPKLQRPMLWIAVCLPELPLEVAAVDAVPLAVCDASHVLLANRSAREVGVQAQMRRATALAICPHLQIKLRTYAQENQALQAIAAWAQRFTPNVALVAPARNPTLIWLPDCCSKFPAA